MSGISIPIQTPGAASAERSLSGIDRALEKIRNGSNKTEKALGGISAKAITDIKAKPIIDLNNQANISDKIFNRVATSLKGIATSLAVVGALNTFKNIEDELKKDKICTH